MLPLCEFPLFSILPTELRALIWSLVPQPTNIIGLLPFACVYPNQPARPESEEADDKPLYHFRQVIQPRNSPVFAPLHACRESRRVWLPRVFQPQRQLRVRFATNHNGEPLCIVIQFDMPFVSYDTDIFTAVGAWKLGDFTGVTGYPQLANVDEGGSIDPFEGFDRTKIKNVGICEIPHGLEGVVQAIGAHALPSLRRFSFITLGPNNGHLVQGEHDPMRYAVTSSLLEMHVLDVRNRDCELRDLKMEAVESSPFLNQSRPRHVNALSPALRPLPRYAAFVKALLWHTRSGSWDVDLEHPAIAMTRWDFIEYVFDGAKNAVCPLPFMGCGTDGHSRDEVLAWEPEFRFDHKLLCQRGWVDTLAEIGLIS